MRKLRGKTMLTAILLTLATAVALWFGFLWAFQTFGIYRFDTTPATPAAVGLPQLRVVHFAAADGTQVSAWVAPPRDDQPVLISFFGGFTNVGAAAPRLRPLLDQGFGLAMLVYRGSSGAGGTPSEAAFTQDALALYDQLDTLLQQPIPAARRVLHGCSLGSSIAAGLAAARPAAGLILEATFDRCTRWYAQRLCGLPMDAWMWRERHDVIDKLAAVTTPKLFLHGARDEVIPIAWAKALYEAAVGEKRFVTYPQGGHADLAEHGALTDIAAFLRALPR